MIKLINSLLQVLKGDVEFENGRRVFCWHFGAALEMDRDVVQTRIVFAGDLNWGRIVRVLSTTTISNINAACTVHCTAFTRGQHASGQYLIDAFICRRRHGTLVHANLIPNDHQGRAAIHLLWNDTVLGPKFD